MQRVLVIGNAAAGKSTFSRALRDKTQLPLVHLDTMYWQENWKPVSREAFDAFLQEKLEEKEWILDGNYNRTLEKRLQYCDTVFFFDFPVWVCLWQAFKRTIRYYGKDREDNGKSCAEKFDSHKKSLCHSIVTFNSRYRKRYLALLSHRTKTEIVYFRNRRQADAYLHGLDEKQKD